VQEGDEKMEKLEKLLMVISLIKRYKHQDLSKCYIFIWM